MKKRLCLFAFAGLILLSGTSALADFYVIPVPSKPLKNVITVAKGGGKFTNPVAAVNSITDASASNPYLVVIGPGVYTLTQTLVMKEYVDIVGSGENVTKLQGAISTSSPDASSAIISGANSATLGSLTVENTGGGYLSIALYNQSTSPTVSHVTAMASGGTYSYGVYNDSSSPTMTNVTATASGAFSNWGVYNYLSSPTMTEVTASSSGGTTANRGVENAASDATMINVIATASGGTYSYGVKNSSSSPNMTNVIATASGGTQSYGVFNGLSSPVIRRSTMEGDFRSLYGIGTVSETYTATVSQSTLIGATSTDTGAVNKCVACDDGSGTPLDGDCH